MPGVASEFQRGADHERASQHPASRNRERQHHGQPDQQFGNHYGVAKLHHRVQLRQLRTHTMPDKFGSGKGSNKTTTDLKSGLKNRSAKFPDKSFKHPGGSVNNDTTR